MLKSIRFKNYKSFSNETVISLEKSKYSILDETNVCEDILKGCAFYGSNASGKTNALNSIALLLQLLFSEKMNFGVVQSIYNNEETSWYEYSFVHDGQDIVYSFEISRSGKIVRENLILNGNSCFTRIENRVESLITENRTYDSGDIDDDMLFLRVLFFNTKLKSETVLENWMKSLSKSMYLNPLSHMGIAFNAALVEIDLESYLEEFGTSELNDFLGKYNFPYSIEYKRKESVKDSIIPFQYRLEFFRNDLPPVPFAIESFGNQLLFNILPSLMMAIRCNSILIIDEFSSGLHNKLEELIIRYYMENTTDGQIFFVSHSTNLLKTSLLRPDQIYAVDFEKGSSILKKFSDEHPRESQNLEKMYLSGVFGGIPLYDKN